MEEKKTKIDLLEQMFEFTKQQNVLLERYVDLVLEKNEHINLTAIKTREDAFWKHLVDSLEITKLKEYKLANSIIDIGTGAGFPGALLAIASPEKKFTLVDSTQKKLRAIEEFCDALEIKNVVLIHARAEELAKNNEYKGKFDLCVSRAVANLQTLIKWCMPFVKESGSFIAYKGENFQEELEAAKQTFEKLKVETNKITRYPEEYNEISNHVLLTIQNK